jgi:hypothetical protein
VHKLLDDPTSVQGAVQQGWHLVSLNQEQRFRGHLTLHAWCQDNLVGRFKTSFSTSNFGSQFAFEQEQDAVMFTLKWL